MNYITSDYTPRSPQSSQESALTYRSDPAPHSREAKSGHSGNTGPGRLTSARPTTGSIEHTEHRPELRRLTEWATRLHAEGLCTLDTYHGKTGRLTLLPRLLKTGSGLVTVWNDGGPSLSLYRSVLERTAPRSLRELEELLGAEAIGQGKTIRDTTDEVLDLLTDAYREAVRG